MSKHACSTSLHIDYIVTARVNDEMAAIHERTTKKSMEVKDAEWLEEVSV